MFHYVSYPREQQGPSALIGTTTMTNPAAFDMEECAAYIPARIQEPGDGDEGLFRGNNPAYMNVATTQGPPTARPHSLLDDDGYDVIPF